VRLAKISRFSHAGSVVFPIAAPRIH
jgi:hypothetical protein